jgi:hypothetical protein
MGIYLFIIAGWTLFFLAYFCWVIYMDVSKLCQREKGKDAEVIEAPAQNPDSPEPGITPKVVEYAENVHAIDDKSHESVHEAPVNNGEGQSDGPKTAEDTQAKPETDALSKKEDKYNSLAEPILPEMEQIFTLDLCANYLHLNNSMHHKSNPGCTIKEKRNWA